MKKKLLIPFGMIFALSLSAITGAYATEDKKEKKTPAYKAIKHKQDVTGDGRADYVTLNGKPYDEDPHFLKEILLKVKTSEGKKFNIKFEGGHQPKVVIGDLNGDSVNDILVSAKTGEGSDTSHYHLYSFKNGIETDLGVPDPLTVSSQFQEDYQAFLKIENTNESYSFDLASRKREYNSLGLYQNGKLNEPMELQVMPYSSLKPVILEGGRKGLRGVQRFCGAGSKDTIGYIHSVWVDDNGEWTLAGTEVKQVKEDK
ncbi:hypothetical protein WQ57_04410 [Mesobacillus campisalis]|uniref:Spore coat protein n=1 Tax=Mesobacillus campisalis TaxID=1408103 RepID=A0A0M2SWV0_9BACI|nr:hypothetical protein [Mesobacillus campisalis]KKK39039.1 hypothetical protein WQ57_04410 [Mesobacillus campisalis]